MILYVIYVKKYLKEKQHMKNILLFVNKIISYIFVVFVLNFDDKIHFDH